MKPFDKIEIIRKCTGFTATQKLILLIIASHLGKNDFCFLSLSTLQKETGLSRSTLSDNLKLLMLVEVIWKLNPREKIKSNQYGINFNLLVVSHYQCSSLGLLGWSPHIIRLVVPHYPKRNLKEKTLDFENEETKQNAEKARENIRKACGLKRKK
jgi:hypothetical protein